MVTPGKAVLVSPDADVRSVRARARGRGLALPHSHRRHHHRNQHGERQPMTPQPGHRGPGRWTARRLRASVYASASISPEAKRRSRISSGVSLGVFRGSVASWRPAECCVRRMTAHTARLINAIHSMGMRAIQAQPPFQYITVAHLLGTLPLSMRTGSAPVPIGLALRAVRALWRPHGGCSVPRRSPRGRGGSGRRHPAGPYSGSRDLAVSLLAARAHLVAPLRRHAYGIRRIHTGFKEDRLRACPNPWALPA